jgi:hypothetical protein
MRGHEMEMERRKRKKEIFIDSERATFSVLDILYPIMEQDIGRQAGRRKGQ